MDGSNGHYSKDGDGPGTPVWFWWNCLLNCIQLSTLLLQNGIIVAGIVRLGTTEHYILMVFLMVTVSLSIDGDLTVLSE